MSIRLTTDAMVLLPSGMSSFNSSISALRRGALMLSFGCLVAPSNATLAGLSLTELGILSSRNAEVFKYSVGSSINSSWQVTGYSPARADEDHAFVYSGGILTDLGTLGGDFSYGTGINDSGQVAGISYIDGPDGIRAFIYSNGVMKNLGTLGRYSVASNINNPAKWSDQMRISAAAVHLFIPKER